MTHLRHFTRPLVVIALLTTGLALAVGAPAGAQSIVKVFEFHHGDDADWEVQITVQALGGCNPANARPGYVTSWLGSNDEDGEVLDPGVCNYRITAVARQTDTPNRLCNAELGWGDSPGTWSNELQTSNRDPKQTTVTARHTGGNSPNCSARPTLSITINPDDVIQELPTSATDSNLEARAKRASEIAEFRVKVTPESTTINRTGCNQTLDFFVSGDGDETEKALGVLGANVECDFRITVTEAPPPFTIRDANGEDFKTTQRAADGTIALDLSEHVQLPYNRVVIIQDVINNPGNQGTAAYKLTTECGGVPALPPIAIGTGAAGSGIFTLPGGETVATLANGRFTVHSPTFANFGPGASYPAVATSTTSDEISGCSVTVSVELNAPGCTLTGSENRSLTWSTASPLRNFDFEFDIYCGGSRPPTPVTPPPATDDPTDTSTDDAGIAPESGTPDVRLVARLLANGKIEFGLQQVEHDNSWSDRLFPRARLFPTGTAVGRWLVSSAITLSVAASDDALADDVDVRIIARRQADGRVEFGLQQRQADDSWGERVLPRRRFFPTSATVDRWLGSSTITLDS